MTRVYSIFSRALHVGDVSPFYAVSLLGVLDLAVAARKEKG